MLFFAMTIFFDVRVIDVRGMTHYDESEVVRLLGFKWGENLMFIDTASAEKNVRDQLPYIRDISISRQLPDRAVVEVVEREPRAAVASGSSYSIFDEEGVIFDHIVIGRPDESIVLIKGVTLTDPKVNSRLDGQDDEHLRPALQVLNALYDYDMIKDVKVIDARESFNIRFDYLGRFTVELGLNDNVADKLRTLDKVVSDLEPHQTGIIDLSAKRTRFVDDTQGGKL